MSAEDKKVAMAWILILTVLAGIWFGFAALMINMY